VGRGARGLVATVSMDGGATWAESVIPGITACSGGFYQRSTGPWVSSSPNGVVHQLALSFNDLEAPFEESTSTTRCSQAARWTGARRGARRSSSGRTRPTIFNDKQSITADPTGSDLVYAIWDRLESPPSERASIVASFNAGAFKGPIWFARSTDGASSWEPAREIFDPGTIAQSIGNQIVVDPDGNLVNIFNLINSSPRSMPPECGETLYSGDYNHQTWFRRPSSARRSARSRSSASTKRPIVPVPRGMDRGAVKTTPQ
jgi:hypothetical protein